MRITALVSYVMFALAFIGAVKGHLWMCGVCLLLVLAARWGESVFWGWLGNCLTVAASAYLYHIDNHLLVMGLLLVGVALSSLREVLYSSSIFEICGSTDSSSDSGGGSGSDCGGGD
ncbi:MULTISPECIES: hypothetical protein [Corallincola]|uniref:Uncharacterized protein n=2 Tax=Corallincola TaxID=1775176 RepID=A0A368NIM0_9GAMM|nr:MULTISPECIES: hypothetical protein [Corallincola]RCU49231.1 hypothetical protein DU002_12840 [Corallincola holothuriorum]TAA47467.1 hypothetical protein EXY25_09605 [Corallincola spongiicola]